MRAIAEEMALPPDVVEVLERLVKQLHADEGIWTIEVHFEHGHYGRAYVKRGPISREEMRLLGQRGVSLSG